MAAPAIVPETQLDDARAKALQALQLPKDATPEQVQGQLEAARAAVADYAKLFGLDADEPDEKRARVEEKDPELAAALNRFADAATGPLQRRARDVHREEEDRWIERPQKASEILRRRAVRDYEIELQRKADELHLVGALCHGIDWEKAELHGLDVTDAGRLAKGRVWREYNDLLEKGYMGLKDGLNTSNMGDWVDTTMSNQVIEAVRLEPSAHAKFDTIPMSDATMLLPYAPGDVMTFILSQVTANWGAASPPPHSTYSPDQRQLVAVKHGTLIEFSAESDEDLILDIRERLTSDIVRGMSEGRDDILLNGDTTATHQDADVTDAADRRKMFPGLRKIALANGATVDLGTPDLAHYRAMRRMLRKYKKGAIWIVGSIGEDDMSSIVQVETMDKIGNRATVLTGDIDQLVGLPVIVSEMVREDVSATGVHSGVPANDVYTTTYAVNVRAFLWGIRRSLQVKLVDAPWAIEQHAVYAAERICLKQIQTDRTKGEPVVLGINQNV